MEFQLLNKTQIAIKIRKQKKTWNPENLGCNTRDGVGIQARWCGEVSKLGDGTYSTQSRPRWCFENSTSGIHSRGKLLSRLPLFVAPWTV